MSRVFLDTNLLVYAFDQEEPEKRSIARDVILNKDATHQLILSTQVLQEFFTTVTRKLKRRLSTTEARDAVTTYARYTVVRTDPVLILAAIDRTQCMSISFWDALIVEAALRSNAETLMTEDLQQGQVIDGLRIVNPFLRV